MEKFNVIIKYSLTQNFEADSKEEAIKELRKDVEEYGVSADPENRSDAFTLKEISAEANLITKKEERK